MNAGAQVIQSPVPERALRDFAALLAAIATAGEPETSARDNLGTLRIIEALYRSGETGESQPIRAEPAATA